MESLKRVRPGTLWEQEYPAHVHSEGGRCFRAVDAMSDEEPKLIAIDEEANHQIVHGDRFGKAPIRRLLSKDN